MSGEKISPEMAYGPLSDLQHWHQFDKRATNFSTESKMNYYKTYTEGVPQGLSCCLSTNDFGYITKNFEKL